MKYAIISDIHGNLEALTNVLAICEQEQVEHYVCLGDVVGYNANPKECLDIVRALPNLTIVKGNHDEYASNGDNVMEGFNPNAKAAVLWTRAQLSEEDLCWLSSLPMRLTIKGANMTIVHATLDGPDAWGYIFDVHNAADNFSYQFTQLCFCGHSHVPVAFSKRPIAMGARPIEEIPVWASVDDGSDPRQADMIQIPVEQSVKYLINIGSVGQPRNRDPRASFCIYDTDLKVLSRYRLPYDYEQTQRKILAAGLPERLATRLERGL